MTHDEFMAKVKSAKSRLKGIDYYYFFAELSIDYISELEIEAKKRDAEIADLKTRLSGKTNHCEACDQMGEEMQKLKKQVSDQSDVIMPLYSLACKNCPPPFRDSEIVPDCPEHEPTCIECWLEWMAKQ